MKTKIEKIGERTYTFGIMPASVAYEVEVALAEVIGEPLFKAIAGGGVGADKEKLLDVSGVAIAMIASRARQANLLPTIKTCFEYVKVDINGSGQAFPINFDVHFTGRNKEMWQVFVAAIKVNFSDFFEGLHFDLAGIAAASKSSQ